MGKFFRFCCFSTFFKIMLALLGFRFWKRCCGK